MMAAVLALASSVPALAAVSLAGHFGGSWTGRTFLAPGDMTVYLSYILQVSDGSWLVSNLFAPESGVPVLNLVWLYAGTLARLMGLSPLASFHLTRVLLVPLLAAAVYWSAGFFLKRRAERLWATALALFASGWGAFVAPFIGSAEMVGGRYEWPIDLWVAESNIFLSALHSPHFLAGWILIIVSMTCLAKSYVESRLDYAAWAGLAALVLFEFHPFHAPTLYGIALVAAASMAAARRPLRKLFQSLLIFGFLSLPSVLYHWWLLQPGRNEATALTSNFNYTPGPFLVIVGFGAMVPLAVVGSLLWRRRSAANRSVLARLLFLLSWIAFQSVAIYAPVIFQRRFVQGLQFPLLLLSSVAVVALLSQSVRRVFWPRWIHPLVGAVLLGVLLIPSSFYALANNLSLMAKNRPEIFYLSRGEWNAARWLHDNASGDDLVLSSFASGNGLPGYSGVRVYAGHWVATPDAERRSEETIRFFGPSDDDLWRQSFLSRNDISLVYVGPTEKRLGAYLMDKDFLRPVHESTTVTIYRVK